MSEEKMQVFRGKVSSPPEIVEVWAVLLDVVGKMRTLEEALGYGALQNTDVATGWNSKYEVAFIKRMKRHDWEFYKHEGMRYTAGFRSYQVLLAMGSTLPIDRLLELWGKYGGHAPPKKEEIRNAKK